MSQTLTVIPKPILCDYIVVVLDGFVYTREHIYLHGLQQAKRQAWLKNCGCKWWVAGLKGH